MYAIAIVGLNGAINARNVMEADELAKTLLYAGYDITMDNERFVLEYGPGYDTVVSQQNGTPLTERVINA